jgi:uncharacterized protein
VRDVTDLPLATLSQARVVALFTIGETPWSDEQRDVLARRVRAGECGFLPLHSTTASCESWPEFESLVGGRFESHPWTQEFTVHVLDGDHPATRHLPEVWRVVDEVYTFRRVRADARVLLAAKRSEFDGEGRESSPNDVLPLAWCFNEGDGRVVYSALGHFPALYEDELFLGHLYGALSWVLDSTT